MSRFAPAETLATDRLVLSPLRVSDAREMAQVLSSERLYTFTGGHPVTVANLHTRYQRLAAGPSNPYEAWFNWSVRRASDEQLVGRVEATLTCTAGQWSASVAWVIGLDWQQQGFASEAARALVAWLHRNGIASVVANIHPDHKASGAVARRAGLQPTSDLKDGETVWRTSGTDVIVREPQQTQSVLAQDPDELFDVVTPDGEPTGKVKRRADVHRDGDWHRAVHIWLIGEDDGDPWILFQRRGLLKDTWAGELDCTVGGHLAAGESLVDAYREVEEEIGITIDPGDLRSVGVRRAINDLPGVHLDRELQDVFLVRDDRPLLDIHPNPVELDAVVRIPLEPLLDQLAGDIEHVEALERPAVEDIVRPIQLRAGDVGRTTDNYFYRVAIAARNALRGDRHIAV